MTDRKRKGQKEPQDVLAPISCAVTWVHGRIIFKDGRKWSKFFYGVCHYSKGVWFITPDDYEKPLVGITTIIVDDLSTYCDKAKMCLNIDCDRNRFNIDKFLLEFKDMGAFSLSFPRDFGKSEDKKDQHNWFNRGEWKGFWAQFTLGKEGGVLRFSEEKARQAQKSPLIIQ